MPPFCAAPDPRYYLFLKISRRVARRLSSSFLFVLSPGLRFFFCLLFFLSSLPGSSPTSRVTGACRADPLDLSRAKFRPRAQPNLLFLKENKTNKQKKPGASEFPHPPPPSYRNFSSEVRTPKPQSIISLAVALFLIIRTSKLLLSLLMRQLKLQVRGTTSGDQQPS